MSAKAANFNNLAKSYARTVVPVIVGLVISLALRAGLDLNGWTPEITSAVTFGWYAAARALEHYVDPRFGWLLGFASKPVYMPTVKRKTARDAGLALIEVLVVILVVLVVLLLLGYGPHH